MFVIITDRKTFVAKFFKILLLAGSPPCPDYVTPLKKRRLARESLSSEQSVTPPTTPTMLTDHHLSSNSPLSQKCAQYDVTGMNLVSLEYYSFTNIIFLCVPGLRDC